MSAPLSKALFHATIETLKPGDVISDPGGVSWATEHLDYALKHGQDRINTGFGRRPGGEYPVHHANIYTVEPVGEMEEDTQAHNKGAYKSRSGYRVTGQVASVLGRQDNRDAIKKNFPEFDPSQEGYVKNGRNG